jgi:hypothetical protein
VKLPFFMRRAIKTIKWYASFKNSGNYWEQRYRRGGSSGAGSVGRLAAFKAEIINKFVSDNDVQSVMEFGFGDGSQLHLASYPNFVGVEISHTALALVQSMHGWKPNVRLIHLDDLQPGDRAELVLSLDVIYHLIENETFDGHMRALFDRSDKYVIIYSSDTPLASQDPHVRHRSFKDWIAINRSDFRLISHIPNRYPFSASQPDQTSFADFFIYERLDEQNP